MATEPKINEINLNAKFNELARKIEAGTRTNNGNRFEFERNKPMPDSDLFGDLDTRWADYEEHASKLRKPVSKEEYERIKKERQKELDEGW